jgi:hypothetical protein
MLSALFQILLFFGVFVVFVNIGFKLARKASKGPDAIASLVNSSSTTRTILIGMTGTAVGTKERRRRCLGGMGTTQARRLMLTRGTSI